MKGKIKATVREMAADHDVEIQSARKVGSRQMGVENDESDYDVMAIHSIEPWKYPAISHSKDTIDYNDGEIEIHSWNINKFARKIGESNPTAIEFLQAVPYIEHNEMEMAALLDEVRENFNRMALYHHYISMATGQYRQYIENGNDKTLNRQFYVAFALARAEYIRKENKLPPCEVNIFLDTQRCLGQRCDTILRSFAEAKSNGAADREANDQVGWWLENESAAEMEATGERIVSPDSEKINAVVKSALKE